MNKLVCILTPIALAISQMQVVSQSSPGLDLRPLSEDQEFVISSNAETCDMVGQVKAYPEFEHYGHPPVYSLANASTIYSVSPDGLLKVSNGLALGIGVDTIQVQIQKQGFQDTTITVSIRVLDSTRCSFIDTSATSNGSGSRTSPYNTPPAVSGDDWGYFFRRGTSVYTTMYSNGHKNLTFAPYGTGRAPTLFTNNNLRAFSIGAGSENLLIDGFEVTTLNPTAVVSGEGSNWGGAIGGWTNNASNAISFSDIEIRNCHFHHLEGGPNIVADAPAPYALNVTFKWNHIHDIATDGIFVKRADGPTVLDANYVHDVNLRWNSAPSEIPANFQSGGCTDPHAQCWSYGDCIQTYSSTETYVRHNLVDRSSTGNKFNIIVDTISGGTDSNEWVEISDNYMISTIGDNSLFMWLYFHNGVVTRNRMVGEAQYAVMHGGTSNGVAYTYNLIESGGIRDGGGRLRNNVFIHPQNFVILNNFGAEEFINNIVVLDAGDGYVYTNGQVTTARNNLYTMENPGMFGLGFDTVAASGETNSLVGDALFVDAQGFDYRLLSTSPAIDAGFTTGDTVDAMSSTVPKGAGQDIGAFEYSSDSIPSNVND